MRVMTILGIRPDFIRMSEVIKGLDAAPKVEHILVHTGQHYSHNMDGVFFEELELRAPDFNFGIGSGTHAEQVARALIETEKLIMDTKPDLCLFLGDNNSALAAISAAKCHVKVARIEGGMRSYDWRMPEEKNRVIVDHISDYIFVYTHRYKENLLLEGIPGNKVFVVGNPIVDILRIWRDRAGAKSRLMEKLQLSTRKFILTTLHREENVDDEAVLQQLMMGLDETSKKLGMPVYFPMSYRTQNRLKEFKVTLSPAIITSDPIGFMDFLNAEQQAALIISDSGTVQEEASILQVPCVVPRLSTERPETIEAGGCMLVGNRAKDIVSASSEMVQRSRIWKHCIGDGKTSERIVRHLCSLEKEIVNREFHPPLVDRHKQLAYSTFIDPLEIVGGGWKRSLDD